MPANTADEEIIDRITASAARRGFSVVSGGCGLSAVERCRPNLTDLIELFFGGDDLGRAIYKPLSQVAHGNYVGVANRYRRCRTLGAPWAIQFHLPAALTFHSRGTGQAHPV